MTDINDLKKAVSSVAKVRSEGADEANKKIAEVEAAIRDLHVPISAILCEDMADGIHTVYSLVYDRIGMGWSLSIHIHKAAQPLNYIWRSAPASARIIVANNLERFTAKALEVARKHGRALAG